MSLSQGKNIISSDDDDDVYGLHSLADRVNAALEHQHTLEFSSINEESESITDEIMKEFQTCLAEKRLFTDTETSDSDETFLNLSKRLQEMYTPINKKKKNYAINESDSDESFSEFTDRIEKFRTPMSEMRNHHKKESCNRDEKLSNSSLKLGKISASKFKRSFPETDDSDSDETFSNFVEKLRTPVSVNRKNYHKRNDSDSDDSFLNSTERLRPFCTPKSQRKCGRRDSVMLTPVSEKKGQCSSTNSFSKENKDASKRTKVCQSEVEKKFNALFPPDTIDLMFLQSREALTCTLYEFFNQTVFSTKLPRDMPLVWDSALTRTAGVTHSSCENGVYSSSIKLSSKLLTSFDRLKNTLLHEMCHAAVWIINRQHKVKHGPLWQIWASRCKMILPFVECPQRCHNYEVPYRVWYHCTKCNWKKGRCKQVKKYQEALCTKCKSPIIMTYEYPS